MFFTQPFWILLVVPLAFLFRAWPAASPWGRILRLLTWSLLLLALAAPVFYLPKRAGYVIVVADRSKSMPDDAAGRVRETIEFLQKTKPAVGDLGVVTFGYQAAVEKFPNEGPISDFSQVLDDDGSNLAEALTRAQNLIPKGVSGRILVLSDGLWTGADPAVPAAGAAARGFPIDFRDFSRDESDDPAITRIEAPHTVSPHEGFLVNAWVLSPDKREITYELKQGKRVVTRGQRVLERGRNRLVFRDLAGGPGTLDYRLEIAEPGGNITSDPIPQNNSASFLVGVIGPKPILLISPSPTSSLAVLLQQAGLTLQVRTPDQLAWNLAELSAFTAVILENTPADEIGDRGLNNLARWVQETGSGLMMTGGKNSYGPGGYFLSPLDTILPVSMELRREHRKLSLAMVIALDRSGSMAMVTADGRTKMDLANLASVQVLDLLAPGDLLSVIAVDSTPHLIFPLSRIEDKAAKRKKILKIDSQGGGIFVYEALRAAASQLASVEAGARHILLFADAADAEQPGKYKELLEKCTQSGITVSVVGLGTAGGREMSPDAQLLIDVARRGKGHIFFTDRAEALPRLFAQDTFLVTRESFVEESTPARFTSGMLALSNKPFSQAPSPAGYNLCYLRDGAEVAMVTRDKHNAPLLAFTYTGNGRVLCYTGEAGGRYAGEMATWPGAGQFFSALARWTAGAAQQLPGKSMITQTVRDGVLRLTLHLDPDRAGDPFQGTPGVSLLRGNIGDTPHAESLVLNWEAADHLSAEIPLRGEETALATVHFPDKGSRTLAPARLPYSPEYEPAGPGKGREALSQLARLTGGVERFQLSAIWRELPRQRTRISLAPVLLFLAVFCFLLDILERRAAVLSNLRRQRQIASPKKKQGIPAREIPVTDEPHSPTTPSAGSESNHGEAPTAATNLKNVLKKARGRAQVRTGKKGRTGL